MPFNGSGTFDLTTAGQPVVTATAISSTMFNAVLTELEVGLSTCIAKDGQTVTTAIIPFAAGMTTTSLQCDSIVNDSGLAHGTYTPTLTNVTNASASTAAVTHYVRLGNQVFVSGAIVIDPTATGATQVDVSLPIASNFTSTSNDINGGIFSTDTTIDERGFINGDTSNDRAKLQFTAVDTTNHGFIFWFIYTVA